MAGQASSQETVLSCLDILIKAGRPDVSLSGFICENWKEMFHPAACEETGGVKV